jgi:membrane protease YdiL (CAAX protease family)
MKNEDLSGGQMKKLSSWMVVLLYAIPTLLSILAVYLVMPWLKKTGWSTLSYYSAAMSIPFAVQLILALSLSKGNLLKSLNYKKLKRADIFWILGTVVFMFVSAGILDFSCKFLSETIFNPPSWWPVSTNPRFPKSTTEFFDQPLAGNWALWLSIAGLNVFGGISEETFGRGYILSRQKGKFAWILNGLLWTLFHAYTPWNYISLLPGCLALAFVTQKRQNTTVALTIHLLVQLIPSLMMLSVI